jgi:hypothetical protein
MNDGRGRMFRWRTCWCPQCRRQHRDLIAFDAPRTKLPPRQLCDECYLSQLAPVDRDRYAAWKKSVSPPDVPRLAAARPTQLTLPFG